MNLFLWLVSLPLRIKLLAGLVLSIVPVILVGLFAVGQNAQSTAVATHTLVEQVAQDRLNAVTDALIGPKATAALIGNDSSNISAFAELAAIPDNVLAASQLSNSFRQAVNAQTAVRQIRFVSIGGRVLVSSPAAAITDDTKQPYFLALSAHLPSAPTSNVYVGDIVESGAIPTLDFVSVPVLGGQPLGYVVVTTDASSNIDLDAISVYKALTVADTSFGKINFYLLDRQGMVFSPVPHISTVNQTDKQSVNRLEGSGSQAAFEYASPISGTNMVGVALPIVGTELTLVAELPALPFARDQGSQFFLLILVPIELVSLLLLFLLALLLNATLLRPVAHLVPLANQAAQGRVLDELEPIQQQDEIGKLFASFIKLTSRMQQNERNLGEQTAQRNLNLEATNAISQALSNIRQVEPLLQQAVTMIHEHFDQIFHVQVYVVDPKREFAALRVSTDDTGKVQVARGKQVSVHDEHIVEQVIAQGEPIVINGSAGSARGERLKWGARSQMALPLKFEGRILGALDLQSTRSDGFAESDIQLYEIIADRLAVAINNALLFEDAQSRLDKYEARNRELLGEAWQTFTDTRRRALVQSGQKNGESYEWTDLQRQAVEAKDIIEQVNGDTVTFAVPVSLRGQVLGAVEWDIPRSAYNDNSRQLARELATRLAISADNARLFEEAQQVAQRERLVNEIASKLTQQTDVTEILKTAVREVGQALHVPQTSIRIATGVDDTPDKPETR